jgi:hypothetical protein
MTTSFVHVVHFPDGETADISMERILQPGDRFRRGGKQWQVTTVKPRAEGVYDVRVVEERED